MVDKQAPSSPTPSTATTPHRYNLRSATTPTHSVSTRTARRPRSSAAASSLGIEEDSESPLQQFNRLRGLRKKDLVEQCASFGFDLTGTKDQIVARLRHHLLGDEPSSSTPHQRARDVPTQTPLRRSRRLTSQSQVSGSEHSMLMTPQPTRPPRQGSERERAATSRKRDSRRTRGMARRASASGALEPNDGEDVAAPAASFSETQSTVRKLEMDGTATEEEIGVTTRSRKLATSTKTPSPKSALGTDGEISDTVSLTRSSKRNRTKKSQALQSDVDVQTRHTPATLTSSKAAANAHSEIEASAKPSVLDSSAVHGESNDIQPTSVDANTNPQKGQAPDAVSPSKLELKPNNTCTPDSTVKSSTETISAVMAKASSEAIRDLEHPERESEALAKANDISPVKPSDSDEAIKDTDDNDIVTKPASLIMIGLERHGSMDAPAEMNQTPSNPVPELGSEQGPFTAMVFGKERHSSIDVPEDAHLESSELESPAPASSIMFGNQRHASIDVPGDVDMTPAENIPQGAPIPNLEEYNDETEHPTAELQEPNQTVDNSQIAEAMNTSIVQEKAVDMDFEQPDNLGSAEIGKNEVDLEETRVEAVKTDGVSNMDCTSSEQPDNVVSVELERKEIYSEETNVEVGVSKPLQPVNFGDVDVKLMETEKSSEADDPMVHESVDNAKEKLVLVEEPTHDTELINTDTTPVQVTGNTPVDTDRNHQLQPPSLSPVVNMEGDIVQDPKSQPSEAAASRTVESTSIALSSAGDAQGLHSLAFPDPENRESAPESDSVANPVAEICPESQSSVELVEKSDETTAHLSSGLPENEARPFVHEDKRDVDHLTEPEHVTDLKNNSNVKADELESEQEAVADDVSCKNPSIEPPSIQNEDLTTFISNQDEIGIATEGVTSGSGNTLTEGLNHEDKQFNHSAQPSGSLENSPEAPPESLNAKDSIEVMDVMAEERAQSTLPGLSDSSNRSPVENSEMEVVTEGKVTEEEELNDTAPVNNSALPIKDEVDTELNDPVESKHLGYVTAKVDPPTTTSPDFTEAGTDNTKENEHVLKENTDEDNVEDLALEGVGDQDIPKDDFDIKQRSEADEVVEGDTEYSVGENERKSVPIDAEYGRAQVMDKAENGRSNEKSLGEDVHGPSNQPDLEANDELNDVEMEDYENLEDENEGEVEVEDLDSEHQEDAVAREIPLAPDDTDSRREHNSDDEEKEEIEYEDVVEGEEQEAELEDVVHAVEDAVDVDSEVSNGSQVGSVEELSEESEDEDNDENDDVGSRERSVDNVAASYSEEDDVDDKDDDAEDEEPTETPDGRRVSLFNKFTAALEGKNMNGTTDEVVGNGQEATGDDISCIGNNESPTSNITGSVREASSIPKPRPTVAKKVPRGVKRAREDNDESEHEMRNDAVMENGIGVDERIVQANKRRRMAEICNQLSFNMPTAESTIEDVVLSANVQPSMEFPSAPQLGNAMNGTGKLSMLERLSRIRDKASRSVETTWDSSTDFVTNSGTFSGSFFSVGSRLPRNTRWAQSNKSVRPRQVVARNVWRNANLACLSSERATQFSNEVMAWRRNDLWTSRNS